VLGSRLEQDILAVVVGKRLEPHRVDLEEVKILEAVAVK
jgi:hypothetical protein